jgi:hypothetical protein
MHADHIGGLVADGRPVFPRAEVFVNRADIAHFTDPARAAAAPALLKSSFAAAVGVVASIRRLQPFDGETALTRVISTVDLSGHTPGHSGFRIADDGESLLIVGDALFHPALHPPAPMLALPSRPIRRRPKCADVCFHLPRKNMRCSLRPTCPSPASGASSVISAPLSSPATTTRVRSRSSRTPPVLWRLGWRDVIL